MPGATDRAIRQLLRVGGARPGRAREHQRPWRPAPARASIRSSVLVAHHANHQRQSVGVHVLEIRRQRARASRVVRAVDQDRRPRGVSSGSSRAGHRASVSPRSIASSDIGTPRSGGRLEQTHRDDGVVHLVPAGQRKPQRAVAAGRRRDRDFVRPPSRRASDARRRRARRPAARLLARAPPRLRRAPPPAAAR